MVLTTWSRVFDGDIFHLVARSLTHLTFIGVVVTVISAYRLTPHRVAVRVALLRADAASGQTIQGRHARRPETAPLLRARVFNVWRIDIAGVSTDIETTKQ